MILLALLAFSVRLAAADPFADYTSSTFVPATAGEPGLDATNADDEDAAFDEVEQLDHEHDASRDIDPREAMLRRPGSWLGRIDVSIVWRHTRSEGAATGERGELWLLGTWRL